MPAAAVELPAQADPWVEEEAWIRRLAEWRLTARDSQRPPAAPWFIWLILAGRGWGKTRTGAEWAAGKARLWPGCRIALVAETYADGRDTMVEGESGLLNVLDDAELRGGSRESAWNRSLGELYLANGSVFKIYSSERPAQLRGPQHHFGWADEPAKFNDATKGPSEDTTWSNLEMGLRLMMERTVQVDGHEVTERSVPQIVATGTPKPVRLLTQKDERPYGLLHRDSTVITKGHTDENLANLADVFRTEVVEPFRSTRLGRQELAAEVLEDTPGALWRRKWIDAGRRDSSPYGGYRVKVVALDPADGTTAGAEQGVALMGLGMDNELYVAHSYGVRVSPLRWLKDAITLAHEEDAIVVVEKNHGGKFLVELLNVAMAELDITVAVQVVTASEGKRTRAEPVALLYEQGFNLGKPIIHHIGYHPELEDQMCNFTGDPKEKSPDRLDAMVWGGKYLMGYSRKPVTLEAEEGAVEYTEQTTPMGAVPWRG